jgi:hypothetical protein
MRRLTLLLALLLPLTLAAPAGATSRPHTVTGYVHTEGASLIDPTGQPLRLRGTSL